MTKKNALISFWLIIHLGIYAGFAQQKSVRQIIDSLSQNYYRNINNNPQTGLHYAEKAFSYFDKLDNMNLKFHVTSNLATALFINNQYEKAYSIISFIDPSLLMDNQKALFHTIKGLIENDLNHIPEAENNYLVALQLYRNLHDRNNEFTVLNNLGLLYNNIGEYKKSLEAYLSCYEIMNDLKNDIDRYKYYLNIGTVSYNLDDFENAQKAYSNALNEARREKDTLRIFRTYEKIAQAKLATGSIDSAVHYYKQTLKSFKKLDLKKDVASILLQLGNIYYKTDQKELSKDYFRESEKIAHENSYLQEEVEAQLKLASYFYDQNNTEEAKSYYLKVIKAGDVLSNPELIKTAYYGLYKIEKLHNETANSLKYLEKNLEYDQVIRQKQMVNERDQTETRFNLKKKELELDNLKISYQLNELQLKNQKQKVQSLVGVALLILIVLALILTLYFQKRKAEKLLADQNKKINQQNQKLIAINKDIKSKRKELSSINALKDELLSIIAHDVKSPLTDLSNLLFVLRKNIYHIKKEDLEKNLALVESNTSNLLNLLNNILSWILNQSSGSKVNIVKFSLSGLIAQNLRMIESSVFAKGLTIRMESDNDQIYLVSDKDIIDLALRNILSNAIKFTHPHGEISIEISKEKNNNIQLRITDNGIGLDERTISLLGSNTDKVPAITGTNEEKGYGIGLSLCKKMLSKINSRLTYQKNEPAGSIFILHLTQLNS